MPRRPILRVEFYDHVAVISGMENPIKCVAYGVLVGENKLAIFIGNWVCNNDVTDMNNIDTITILKSTIIKKKILGWESF